MKIIHIIPSLIKGGAERLAIDICQELMQQGHEVKLVTFRPQNDYADICNGLDLVLLPVYVIPSVLGPWKINIQPLNQLIESFRPDVIHSHLFEAELVSREKIYPGIKYITHCHDNMPQLNNFSLKTLFNKALLTNLYEKAHLINRYKECNNRFIAISKDTQQYFEKALPASLSKNILLLHNAINFKRFNAVNNSRSLDKISIVNAGSFVPKKNQQFFIAIAEELKQRGLQAEIKLLGNGPLHSKIEAEVKNHKLQNMITMPGNISAIEQHYAHANVYVHTATYEPFGLVLLEAMATGLPVISLDGRGNRGLVEDGVNGYMFKEQDATKFADAIIDITQNTSLYQAMSNNAVALAKQYDITPYAARLTEIYNA